MPEDQIRWARKLSDPPITRWTPLQRPALAWHACIERILKGGPLALNLRLAERRSPTSLLTRNGAVSKGLQLRDVRIINWGVQRCWYPFYLPCSEAGMRVGMPVWPWLLIKLTKCYEGRRTWILAVGLESLIIVVCWSFLKLLFGVSSAKMRWHPPRYRSPTKQAGRWLPLFLLSDRASSHCEDNNRESMLSNCQPFRP